MKTDEPNYTTKKCLLRLNQQVKIRIPKKTAEECIVVLLNIFSANITDHIIDLDIHHEAFMYLVD